MPNIFEEIKFTVSKILKIYHAFVELHEKDRSLAKEMETYAKQNERYGLYYKKMMESSPDSIKIYYAHIEAMIKLSPALNLCIKDHYAQLEESTKQINRLTEALNNINFFIGNGMEKINQSELTSFQKNEDQRAKELILIFPELEKNHDSISLRFATIQNELSRYSAPDVD